MDTVQLQAYDDWLAEHLDELVAGYPGKVVAIHQGQLILVGDCEDDVYSQIRSKQLEPTPLVFRVPREEDLQSIL
jgi:hypothetical protein